MARKKGGGHGGGHGWFVTFADLMGLLMAFFVMLTAFSTQDQKKLQLVAGSFRDAFGIQKDSKLSGIVEMEGIPTRPFIKYVEKTNIENASDHTGPREIKRGGRKSDGSSDTSLALAAATLRQSLNTLPEIMNETKMVAIEETRDGLEIALLDGDNRSMFPLGTTEPFDRTRRVIEALAEPLSRLPNSIRIVGHSSSEAGTRGMLDGWRLSAGRALAIREILGRNGIPTERFDSVSGKADTDPLFPEDPRIPANRRVTLTLLPAAPPAPPKR